MTFGVTPTGFNTKTLQDILTSLRTAQHAAPELGPNLDVSDLSPTGQLNGTFASEAAELWELAHEAFVSFDPEQAADYALTAISSLTGTARRSASASKAAVSLNLEPGALVPEGALVSVDGRPDIVFALDADVENTGGVADDFPSTATCTQTGPIGVNSGTLTVIVNAVSGWNSVTNVGDAQPGRPVDSDITLRQRRSDQLALRGGSTLRAIRADLLDSEGHPELDGILDVLAIENTSDAVDENGLPGHSFECIIDDGAVASADDDDIAQAIFETKPAGIYSNGGVSGTATDENGDEHTVAFSRPTRRNVYVDLTLTTGPTFPVNGLDQVTAAVVAVGEALGIGDDVVALQVRAAALSVTGVIDVPFFAIGFAPSPTLPDNLTVGLRERAIIDDANVTVD